MASKSRVEVPTVLVECKACHGAGELPLPAVHCAVYELVEHGIWKTTSVIAHGLGGKVAATALANRLTHLEKLGLVEGRQVEHNGRMKEWRRL